MDGALPALKSFRQRLQELGYVEGRNLELFQRWGEARADLLTRFGTELSMRESI
jgi:Fe2+ transport system protein FeoA